VLTSLQPQDNFLLRQEDRLFGRLWKKRQGGLLSHDILR
jgi:hypothetical protein